MTVAFTQIEFGSQLYDQEIALRDRLLRKPLGLTFSQEDLLREDQEIHFGLVDQGTVVACVVGKPLGDGEIKLRQMAVDDARQREGLGTRLMDEVESQLVESGFRQIELNARELAVSFYERLGYKIVGDRFTEVTIAHFKMIKQIQTG